MNRKGEPDKNYFRASHLALASNEFKDLNHAAQILYFHLCRLRNKYGRVKTRRDGKIDCAYFIRSDRQLMQDTGLSKQSIFNARKELLSKRFIYLPTIANGRRTKYQIMDETRSNQ